MTKRFAQGHMANKAIKGGTLAQDFCYPRFPSKSHHVAHQGPFSREVPTEHPDPSLQGGTLLVLPILNSGSLTRITREDALHSGINPTQATPRASASAWKFMNITG